MSRLDCIDNNDLCNDITLTSNKSLDLIQLKLPPSPAEYLQISYESNESEETIQKFPKDCMLPFAASSLLDSPIKDCQFLPSYGNPIMELELESKCLDFEPGDTIGILPRNKSEEVDYVIDRLNLNNIADNKIYIESNNGKKSVPMYIPKCGTIRTILTWCLDIRSISKKTFIRCLCNYTNDPEEKKRLQQLSSVQGAADYRKFILETGTSLIDLLQNFKSCQPPFERLIEHIPRLMPRPYSICSSPFSSCIKIVLSLKFFKHNVHGICSGWLYQLVNSNVPLEDKLEYEVENEFCKLSLKENNDIYKDDRISFYLRKSTNFRLPQNDTTYVLMIGAGTGIAPFLGFLRHRHHQQKITPTRTFGEMILFYGCRYKRDFPFKRELNFYYKSELLTKLFLSHSQENHSDIKYVQDNIRQNQDYIYDFIFNKNAVVYVCGNSQMTKDVKNELENCIRNIRNVSVNEATQIVEDLIKNNQYVEDAWT